MTALSILEGANAGELASKKQPPLTPQEIKDLFSPYDMKRLISYSNNMLDYHVILDLLPSLSTLYFTGRFANHDCKLTGVQSSILLALGLQRKEIEEVEKELKLPVAQSLALFVKIIRKLVKALEDIQKSEIDKSIPQQSEEEQNRHVNGANASQALAADLDAGADEATSALRAQQREIIDSLDLDQYKIASTNEGDDSAWQNFKDLSKVVSVKNPAAAGAKRKEREDKETPSKSDSESKKHKKDKKQKKHTS